MKASLIFCASGAGTRAALKSNPITFSQSFTNPGSADISSIAFRNVLTMSGGVPGGKTKVRASVVWTSL